MFLEHSQRHERLHHARQRSEHNIVSHGLVRLVLDVEERHKYLARTLPDMAAPIWFAVSISRYAVRFTVLTMTATRCP